MIVEHSEVGLESLDSRPSLVIGGIAADNVLEAQENKARPCLLSQHGMPPHFSHSSTASTGSNADD